MSRLIVTNIETQNIKFDSDTTAFTISSDGGIGSIKAEGTATTNLQQGLAKSWINLNGTGTIAARDSLNVSSLTDAATGDHQIFFANDMANNNYSSSVNSGGSSVVIATGRSGNSSTFGNNSAWIRVGSREGNSQAWQDQEMMAVTVHGDLA